MMTAKSTSACGSSRARNKHTWRARNIWSAMLLLVLGMSCYNLKFLDYFAQLHFYHHWSCFDHSFVLSLHSGTAPDLLYYARVNLGLMLVNSVQKVLWRDHIRRESWKLRHFEVLILVEFAPLIFIGEQNHLARRLLVLLRIGMKVASSTCRASIGLTILRVNLLLVEGGNLRQSVVSSCPVWRSALAPFHVVRLWVHLANWWGQVGTKLAMSDSAKDVKLLLSNR